MFRKMIAAALALVAVLSFAACGTENAPAGTTAQTAAATQTTIQTTADTAEDTTAATEAATEPASTEPAPTEPAAKVNEAILSTIELTDSFPVKITKKEVVKNYFGTGMTVDGNDGLLFEVTNSLNEKISGYNIVVLAVDKNGQDVKPFGGGAVVPQLSTVEYSRYVQVVAVDDQVAAGAEYAGVCKCMASKFENIHMIVLSYIDANGNEVINENAIEWLSHTKPE